MDHKPLLRTLATFTLLLLAPGLQAATKHKTVEIVPLEPFTIPASAACGFDVKIEPLSNKEKLTTFYNQQGLPRFLTLTGSRKVRLTNLSTGKSLVQNISGPAHIVEQPDGTFLVAGDGSSGFLFCTWCGSRAAPARLGKGTDHIGYRSELEHTPCA